MDSIWEEELIDELTVLMGGPTREVVDRSGVINRMKKLAEQFRGNPKGLFPYFERDNLLGGVAASAYLWLTSKDGPGDIVPILEHPWGGLGAIVHETPEGLEVGGNRFDCSVIGGHAFPGAVTRGNAFQYSVISGSALRNSENYDDTLQHSRKERWALEGSMNYDRSGQDSFNRGWAYNGSANAQDSHQGSFNLELAFANSNFYDGAGKGCTWCHYASAHAQSKGKTLPFLRRLFSLKPKSVKLPTEAKPLPNLFIGCTASDGSLFETPYDLKFT
ncbi:hypothetical protein HYU14_07485 [Candidatus Woesearchaeota archaeon]|nr:hypothetical protein [Candidatus Woesearchaeota archaeon]